MLAVREKNDGQIIKEELERMKGLLAGAMEEGAFGLSTGLEFAPGIYSETGELIGLCRVVANGEDIGATQRSRSAPEVQGGTRSAAEVARCAEGGVSGVSRRHRVCDCERREGRREGRAHRHPAGAGAPKDRRHERGYSPSVNATSSMAMKFS